MTATRFHTADGRMLHGERHGIGSPVVVFEAGMGASRNSWGAVVPRVAEQTSVVLYDRSGLGRSEPTTGPRNLEWLAADLVDVLDALGDGPFILVGHSWGGPIVRSVAARRPTAIAGLVLVGNCRSAARGGDRPRTSSPTGDPTHSTITRVAGDRGQVEPSPDPTESS